MTLTMVCVMMIVNVDAFGQCGLCSGNATGTDAVAVGGNANGVESGAFGALSVAYGEESIAIGTATVGTSSTDADGSFAFGLKVFSYGDNSFAIGHKVETDANDTYSYIFGRGLLNTQFINDISNSIMFGMNSDVPTLFIEGAAGSSGSIGRVGIGTTDPDGLLHLVDESNSNTDLVIEKAEAYNGRLVFQNAGTELANIRLKNDEDLVIECDQSNGDILFKVNDGID